MTRSQFIFYISIRGVLLSLVMIIVTFLNISTVAVIYKNRVLQITSNALIVCFSVGHSLAVISATTFLLSDYVLHRSTLAWKINCVLLTSFTLYQQANNVFTITAISIERVYSIYYPLHSYKFNSFSRMSKVAVSILSISLIETITQITIGFTTGNFTDTSICTPYTIVGRYGFLFGIIIFSISSFACHSMSLLIVGKLIHQKHNGNLRTNAGPTNTEYKITKMLITGK